MHSTAFIPLSQQKHWPYHVARCGKILLLALLVCAALGNRSAWAVSLSEAVMAARSLSPTLLASEKQRLILEQQTKQALSGYLPTLDLSATVGNEQTDSPSTRSAKEGRVSLPHKEVRTAISQMLFDGFNVSNEVKKARAHQKAADWSYQAAVQTVTMGAVEQFLEVQKQQELLDKIQQFSAVQADFLDKIQEWYQGGAGTVAEVWQTDSRLALTRSSMATVESQLATAQDQFSQLFGFRPASLDPVPSVSTALPHTLAQAVEQAIQHHPSLLEAQDNREAADAARAAARAGLWPSIHLALENNRTNNSSGFDGETETTAAMVRLSYNLFRGGTDQARSQEFVRRLEQTEAQAEQVKQTVQKNVEKSWRVIQELRQRLTALQRHEAVSKQVAEAYHEQFIADQRSLLDVLNAENELFTAQSNRVSGHYALLVEEYRLLANMGQMDVAPGLLPEPSHAEAKEARLTLQEAWLTPASSVILYHAPQTTETVVKELPKQTALRILQTCDNWMQVIDSEGTQGWITGVTTPRGQMQSGMFTFTESPDSRNPPSDGQGNAAPNAP